MNEQVPTGMPLLYLVMYIAFFAGVMYLLVFRPQKKREKKAREMVESLKVGDKVVTVQRV